MGYSVVIKSSRGQERAFVCGGTTDQAALIYAGKVVELHGDRSDPDAAVIMLKDGNNIGPSTSVRELTVRAV